MKNQQNNEQAQKNPSFVVPPLMWLSLGAVLVSVGVGLGLFFKEPIAEAYSQTTQMLAPTPLSLEELTRRRKVEKCESDARFLRGHRDLYEDNRLKNCQMLATWDVAYAPKAVEKKTNTPTVAIQVETPTPQGKP